jgi:hypothetical protein
MLAELIVFFGSFGNHNKIYKLRALHARERSLIHKVNNVLHVVEDTFFLFVDLLKKLKVYISGI